jgi:hypothetical protein
MSVTSCNHRGYQEGSVIPNEARSVDAASATAQEHYESQRSNQEQKWIHGDATRQAMTSSSI